MRSLKVLMEVKVIWGQWGSNSVNTISQEEMPGLTSYLTCRCTLYWVQMWIVFGSGESSLEVKGVILLMYYEHGISWREGSMDRSGMGCVALPYWTKQGCCFLQRKWSTGVKLWKPCKHTEKLGKISYLIFKCIALSARGPLILWEVLHQ